METKQTRLKNNNLGSLPVKKRPSSRLSNDGVATPSTKNEPKQHVPLEVVEKDREFSLPTSTKEIVELVDKVMGLCDFYISESAWEYLDSENLTKKQHQSLLWAVSNDNKSFFNRFDSVVRGEQTKFVQSDLIYWIYHKDSKILLASVGKSIQHAIERVISVMLDSFYSDREEEHQVMPLRSPNYPRAFIDIEDFRDWVRSAFVDLERIAARKPELLAETLAKLRYHVDVCIIEDVESDESDEADAVMHNRAMHTINGNRRKAGVVPVANVRGSVRNWTKAEWFARPKISKLTQKEKEQSWIEHTSAKSAERNVKGGPKFRRVRASASRRDESVKYARSGSQVVRRRNTDVGMASYFRSIIDPWTSKGVKIPDITTYPSSTFQIKYEFPFQSVTYNETAASTTNGFLMIVTPDPSVTILPGFPNGGTVLGLATNNDGVPFAYYSPEVESIVGAYTAIRPVSMGAICRSTDPVLLIQGTLCAALWPSYQAYPFTSVAATALTYKKFQEFLGAETGPILDGARVTTRPMDESAFLYHRKPDYGSEYGGVNDGDQMEVPFFAPGDSSVAESFFVFGPNVVYAEPYSLSSYSEYAVTVPWRGVPAIAFYGTGVPELSNYVLEIVINYEGIPDNRTWSLVQPSRQHSISATRAVKAAAMVPNITSSAKSEDFVKQNFENMNKIQQGESPPQSGVDIKGGLDTALGVAETVGEVLAMFAL
jgi:hypothetical protein